jgi:hypothetical protein
MLPKLILQRVFDNLLSVKQVDGAEDQFMIEQRDCVENLVRNLFNLALLFENGDMRSEVEAKIAGSPLHSFYLSCSPEERISQVEEIGRKWLDYTLHFERFGVVYNHLQGNREVLTGIDNIVSLIIAMTTPTSSNIGIAAAAAQYRDTDESTSSQPSVSSTHDARLETARLGAGQHISSKERAANIKHVCALLSTSSSITLSWNGGGLDIPNYSDVSLKFQFTGDDGKRHNEKVKLLVTTDHVCIRHGNQLSC